MANSGEVEMERELYVAAMKGYVGLLRAQNNEYLLRKTRQNRNVLHVATRYEQIEFIKELLFEKFPNNYKMISDKETSNKNTPLHVAAEVGNYEIMSILYDYSRSVDCPFEGQESQQSPWLLKNSKGNTVVHVALLHDNLKVAKQLLENNDEYATILNELDEAPLHIAMKQHVNHFEIEATAAKIRDPIDKGGAALKFRYEREEDMSSMIELLVKKASSVASWPDKKGLTPLLRAASLGAPYNLQTIKLLIKYCPQSAEVCDAKGNSILHLITNNIPSHQDFSSLMCLTEIFTLRNHQDHQGNTPLHIAVKNKDINMVRVLLENSPKLYINNSDGKTALSLLRQHNVLQGLRQRKMTKEESKAAERGDINFLKQRLTKVGLTFVLSIYSDGKNLLHKLLQLKSENQIEHDNFVDFIEEILEIFPTLVSQTDENGNTPVHILAQNNYNTKVTYFVSADNNNNNNTTRSTTNHFIEFSLELLKRCNTCIVKNKNEADKNNEHYDLTWLVKNNVAGNTPLHEAIIANNTYLALRLLEFNQTTAGVVNNSKETPLHLLARYNHDMCQFDRKDIEKMVAANEKAAEWPDKDGLTPILRAFTAGNESVAVMLCEVVSPEAVAIYDAYGNTFWHLLVRHPSSFLARRLLKINALRELLKQGDVDGNTSLHLAIKENRFDIVKEFLEMWDHDHDHESLLSKGIRSPSQSNKWLLDLLEKPNKAGETPGELISQLTCLPHEIEEKIKDTHEMVGIRSEWGIPTKQTKTYVNSIGIIAALLATITFTAAFTVPGGLFQDTGIPIMLERPAFQVFMILDVIAMCLSMMVLVCLLKIMATNNKRNSVIVLDLSISLLLTSFFATIVTFMVGLFAAMFNAKPWIAIVTLALCCLLIMLVFKFLFIKVLLHLKTSQVYRRWIFKKGSEKKKKADGEGVVNPPPPPTTTTTTTGEVSLDKVA